MLGRLEDVPLNVPESHSVTYDVESMMNGMDNNPAKTMRNSLYNLAELGLILMNQRSYGNTAI